MKLYLPGKYYKEVLLTTDQVSSLPALRVSAGWWGRVVVTGSAEGLRALGGVRRGRHSYGAPDWWQPH